MPRQCRRQNHLGREIRRLIDYHVNEYELTLADAVGVLHVVATELTLRATRDDDDDGEHDRVPVGPQTPDRNRTL